MIYYNDIKSIWLQRWLLSEKWWMLKINIWFIRSKRTILKEEKRQSWLQKLCWKQYFKYKILLDSSKKCIKDSILQETIKFKRKEEWKVFRQNCRFRNELLSAKIIERRSNYCGLRRNLVECWESCNKIE